ncbi:MAG: NAD(P)H-dependent oxidoreductase [Thaumarchaeota archaeon]|nr:NAD(P)H-dependent oxidoreductase [Nitrososphaerota archaeon]
MVVKILGVGSSMREGSRGTLAVKIALDFARRHGAETRLLDLRQTELPMYSPDESDDPQARKVEDDINWADAFVLATPDYHGSMSGSMKNFLDHFWSEFAGKTFGYLCTSHEKGLTVMDQMRTAVRQCYGWSLPYGVAINPEEDFNSKGEITNATLSLRIEMLARDLTVYGQIIHEQFLRDLSSNEAATFVAHYRK